MKLFYIWFPTAYYNEQEMIDFLREYQDRVDWGWIRNYVKLTYRIVHEFENKLSDI